MATLNAEFEKLAYDEAGNEICKPIKQEAIVELKNCNMDNLHSICSSFVKLGFKRKCYKFLNGRHYMEFEK